ncbi:MAG TPA: hypothetical protein VF381_03720 [Thermoanaerobaculia bacterium]
MFQNQNQVIQNPAAADTPQQTPAVTPEGIIQQLRAVSAQIPEVSPLTPQQREVLRRKARTAKNGEIVESSISIIGAADLVSQAVGQSADEVHAMCDESGRWSAVEDELRAMLNGVAGANLIRRQKISAIAERAYGVGSQLARDPEHAALVPHVEEIKRLRKLRNRKKPAKTPQSPAPQSPAPSGPTAPKA